MSFLLNIQNTQHQISCNKLSLEGTKTTIKFLTATNQDSIGAITKKGNSYCIKMTLNFKSGHMT